MTWECLKKRLLKKKDWKSMVMVNNFKENKPLADCLEYKYGKIELDNRGCLSIRLQGLTPNEMSKWIKRVEMLEKRGANDL